MIITLFIIMIIIIVNVCFSFFICDKSNWPSSVSVRVDVQMRVNMGLVKDGLVGVPRQISLNSAFAKIRTKPAFPHHKRVANSKVVYHILEKKERELNREKVVVSYYKVFCIEEILVGSVHCTTTASDHTLFYTLN